VDRDQQRESELVALSTAALLTYHQIMGSSFKPLDVSHANAVLREVARAISSVAPIYAAVSATERAKALPDLELLSGEFLRGASVLRTSRGVEYRQLCIRRVDMRSAIAILRRAGVRFTTPAAASCWPGSPNTPKKTPTSGDAGAPARK
jgi:hypothetical protein